MNSAAPVGVGWNDGLGVCPKEIAMQDRIYMVTIQHGYGDRLKEWETHIRAPDIFRAAEIVKTDCEQRDWHVIAIEEVDYE